MEKMKNWLRDKSWNEVYKDESAHNKAEVFQNILVQKMNEIFPEKIRKINSDDQPWMTYRIFHHFYFHIISFMLTFNVPL